MVQYIIHYEQEKSIIFHNSLALFYGLMQNIIHLSID